MMLVSVNVMVKEWVSRLEEVKSKGHSLYLIKKVTILKK